MKDFVATLEEVQSLPTSVVILDASGKIVAVNDTWKQFGKRNGLRVPHFAVGSNYLRFCQSDEPHSRRFADELGALLAGNLDLLTFFYPCHSPTQERWFSLIGLPLSPDTPGGVALLHVNLTDMLPRPISKRRKQAKPAINLDVISGAVERSVSETLSSQLSTIFAVPPAPGKDATRGETDQNHIRGRLSERQRQVLRLLGEGKTNKEIAKTLFLSPNTIKLHVSAILKRLKLKSRTQAALLSSRLNKQGSIDLFAGNLRSWKKIHSNATYTNRH